MHTEAELKAAIDRYSDTVKRLCMVYLKNHADTEDIFQTVFMRYALSDKQFESREHEKAWFIRVTMNACKDLLKSFFHSRNVPLDEVTELSAPVDDTSREVLDAVLRLPEKYRQVVYLHYYEQYTAPEMAALLNKNVNTIYTLLKRAKDLLRKDLGGEDDDK